MEIPLNSKDGRLSFSALCSTDVYEDLMKYSWHVTDTGYVQSEVHGRTTTMHKYLMKTPKGMVVDHINGIRHDNRRENLRILTKLGNNQNRRKKKGVSSLHRGVGKIGKRWCASITVNGNYTNLGGYKEEHMAAEAFDVFVVHNNLLHPLNYPEKRFEYLTRRPFKSRVRASKYKGVTKQSRRYRARISHEKTPIELGVFESEIMAAKSIDSFIVAHNLDRTLNFPSDYPNYVPPHKPIKTLFEEIDDMTVRIIIPSKLDSVVLIDRDRYDMIKYDNFALHNGYVISTMSGQRLSRILMEETDPEVYIDHIDRNRLNNCMSNLRRSDGNLNSHNKTKREGASSTYFNVMKNPSSTTWRAVIRNNYKRHDVGCFKTEELAARKRDIYVLDNFPDQHYPLNFTWTPEEIEEWRNK